MPRGTQRGPRAARSKGWEVDQSPLVEVKRGGFLALITKNDEAKQRGRQPALDAGFEPWRPPGYNPVPGKDMPEAHVGDMLVVPSAIFRQCRSRSRSTSPSGMSRSRSRSPVVQHAARRSSGGGAAHAAAPADAQPAMPAHGAPANVLKKDRKKEKQQREKQALGEANMQCDMFAAVAADLGLQKPLPAEITAVGRTVQVPGAQAGGRTQQGKMDLQGPKHVRKVQKHAVIATATEAKDPAAEPSAVPMLLAKRLQDGTSAAPTPAGAIPAPAAAAITAATSKPKQPRALVKHLDAADPAMTANTAAASRYAAPKRSARPTHPVLFDTATGNVLQTTSDDLYVSRESLASLLSKPAHPKAAAADPHPEQHLSTAAAGRHSSSGSCSLGYTAMAAARAKQLSLQAPQAASKPAAPVPSPAPKLAQIPSSAQKPAWESNGPRGYAGRSLSPLPQRSATKPVLAPRSRTPEPVRTWDAPHSTAGTLMPAAGESTPATVRKKVRGASTPGTASWAAPQHVPAAASTPGNGHSNGSTTAVDKEASAYVAEIAFDPAANHAEAAMHAGLVQPGTPVEVSRLLMVPGSQHSSARVQIAARAGAAGPTCSALGMSFASRSAVFDAVVVSPASAERPAGSCSSAGSTRQLWRGLQVCACVWLCACEGCTERFSVFYVAVCLHLTGSGC